MNQSLSIDLGRVAHDLHLPLSKVERTVELLDEGNTIPFITRFRKDQTEGLDEQQIRDIQFAVAKLRQLAERKQTILKTIESQGKLTPELSAKIHNAHTAKHVEDLYLPYKPKKQTLATIAREKGLEPLASEIIEAADAAKELLARAAEFVSAEKELPSTAEVLAGVGHLIAERFGENGELRGRLRKIFQKTGKIVCTKVETPTPAPAEAAAESAAESPAEEAAAAEPVATDVPASEAAVDAEATATETAAEPAAEVASEETTEAAAEAPTVDAATGEALPAGRLFEMPEEVAVAPDVKKKKKKKKKKVIGDHAFKDYYDFQESLSKLPPHRVLAINRGEKARAIRVKFEADVDALAREAEAFLVRADHPHGDYLRQCVRDSLTRLIVPSLEREIRREITDSAEEHAVDVFIRNLRKLLLQQPVRGRRVLAIDPGFKSGCKMVALDEFGNVLGHGVVYVIGKDDRREKAKTRIADFAKLHSVSIIAIGNGSGSREAEQLVAEVLASELAGSDIAYVIVNEAGASIYSTSPLGREELPQYDALQRGAISIGRRLLDPLSEMVKINPANVGVGLYQHDIKAKHLRDSLDGVVESCVNFVGVDVNSASPALLRYVSGMNALTARRVYEYRREHGPFKNREELKKVTGFGDSAFIQAAGFLKILGGENPLDATWIHPESYEIARRVLEKIGSSVEELAATVPAPVRPAEKPQFAAALLEDGTAAPATDAPAVEGSSEAPAVEAAAQAEAPAAETPAAEAPAPVAEAPAPSAELEAAKTTAAAAAANARNVIAERAAGVNVDAMAAELSIGTLLLKDILNSLTRPGLDPRDTLAAPVMRKGIMKLEDLTAGMELSGTVLNVVDFGAFVDIGLSDSGLIHISRLADRYIKDPHEVVGVGDVLKVWVVEVDKSRRRVSLTAIAPGSEKPARPPRGERPERAPRGDRPPRGPRPPQGAPAGGAPAGEGRPAGGGDRRGNDRRGGQGGAPAGAGQGGGRDGGRREGGRPEGGRRDGGRRDGGRRDNRYDQPRTIERESSLPKVVKPITKKMETGKEAMRSFSDLAQLFEKKKDPKGDK